MSPSPAQETEGLEDEILPVVIRIVDSEINEFHSIRERIECRPVFLVRRCHDNPERPLLRMLKQPANLVQKNPFHPAGIVEGVYAKEEGHSSNSAMNNEVHIKVFKESFLRLTLMTFQERIANEKPYI